MRSTLSRLMPLLFAAATLAACGTPASIPSRGTSAKTAVSPAIQPPNGRSRCGDPDDCAHIRLVAPLQWHLLRGITLGLDAPQCASAMVPPHLNAGDAYPLDADPFSTPFNHLTVPVGIAFMADPCVTALTTQAARHTMTLIPAPMGPPAGAVPTDYLIMALHVDANGELSAQIVATPAYALDGTLYYDLGNTLALTRGTYAFYLATMLHDKQ